MKKVLLLLTLFLILAPCFCFGLEVDYPALPGGIQHGEDMDSVIAYRFTFAIAIAFFLGILILIIGGMRYFLSFGDVSKMISAREQIGAAFLGIVILLSSVIVLKTINPGIVTLGIPTFEEIKEFKVNEITTPNQENYSSSINTDLAIGRLIEERLLQIEIPEGTEEEQISRMERINDLGYRSLELARKVVEQVDKKAREENDKDKEEGGDEWKDNNGSKKDLSELYKECKCSQSKPCCEEPDPGEGCKDNTCITKPGCTCDPCKSARNNISEREEENLKILYKGVEVKEREKEEKNTSTNSSGSNTDEYSSSRYPEYMKETEDTKTDIRKEIERAEEEIAILREEIDKLERIERLLLDWGTKNATNRSDALTAKTTYETAGWYYKVFPYWPDIKSGKDWDSLSFSIGGTDWSTDAITTTGLEVSNAIESSISSASSTPRSNPIGCSIEVPIGEIIERAKRNSYKLIERMEKLIALEEKLTKSVNELHELISQCSSQGPSADPIREGCISICQKVLGNCIKTCEGNPCPDQAIDEKVKEIVEIVYGDPANKLSSDDKKKEKEGIKDIYLGKKKEKEEAIKDDEWREQIGIKEIIEKIVPEIIIDINKSFKESARFCTEEGGSIRRFESCDSIKGQGLGPTGNLIRFCGYSEKWFEQCMNRCYMQKYKYEEDENSEEKYHWKKCFDACKDDKAKETGFEEIKGFYHKFNFYCCSESNE